MQYSRNSASIPLEEVEFPNHEHHFYLELEQQSPPFNEAKLNPLKVCKQRCSAYTQQ